MSCKYSMLTLSDHDHNFVELSDTYMNGTRRVHYYYSITAQMVSKDDKYETKVADLPMWVELTLF